MITCPECGLEAPDGATFCDRCGRGLANQATSDAPVASRPAPLDPGKILNGGVEITGLIRQDSLENLYRAVRRCADKTEKLRLRERFGPAAEKRASESPAEGAVSAAEEDAAGPRAPTKELKPPRSMQANETPAAEPCAPPSSMQEGTESEPAASAAEDLAQSASSIADETDRPGPDAQAASADGGPQAAQADTGVTDLEAATEEAPHLTRADDASPSPGEDLGEVFGRVLAVSLTLNHPALVRAISGFADKDRVYLVYPDDEVVALANRPQGPRMSEPEATATAIQLCQVISFIHRRGLRLNDICPESVAIGPDRRLKLTGLDHLSNDNEVQSEPLFNDGYTAPEIYRGKKVDKRADVFSAGAMLYTMLTGERLQSETWREQAEPVTFYPPHVVSPALEQAVCRALLFNPEERWPTADEFKAALVKLGAEIGVRAVAMTDVGRVRELNEDAVIRLEYFRDSKVDPAQYFAYSVCDGMGGAEAGETASAIAVGTIREYLEDRLSRGEAEDLGTLAIEALEQANLRIVDYQKQHPEARGMGSTGVLAILVPPKGAVAWVGDSRAYALEGSELRQLTRDHSLVQRLVEIGQITPQEARHHEHKNVITRSLGARQSGAAGAESVPLRLRRGDKLLLCSDGLTTHVEDADISGILRRHDDPHGAARELIAAANAGGGTDNISVVVVFAS